MKKSLITVYACFARIWSQALVSATTLPPIQRMVAITYHYMPNQIDYNFVKIKNFKIKITFYDTNVAFLIAYQF